LPLIGLAYNYLFRRFKPAEDIVMFNIRGNKMYADVHDGFGPGEIRGYYEKGETEIFKQVVREGMIVADLGAHIGYYTLIAAKLVGEKGKVYAFEPEPNNYRLMVKSVAANGYNNVIPVQKAVSNQTGTTKLFLSSGHDGDSGSHAIYQLYDCSESIHIETITLDEYFKGKENRIDIVKMDIEGAEIAALQGMTEILKKNDNLRIIAELSPPRVQSLGYSLKESVHQLLDCGFNFYRIYQRKGKVMPVHADDLVEWCANGGTTNFFISRTSLF